MAPSLADLSTETLSLILSQFCLHCTKAHNYDSPDGYFHSSESGQQQHPDEPSWYSRDYRTALHSMCLVSRRFLPLAQSFLHHEFIPGYGDAWRSKRFSWDGRLASFVRTTAARPDLATLVKHIYVHVYLLRSVTEEEAQATLENAIGATADDYLACFQGTQDKVNIAGLKLVGVMLALLPNLDRLSLQTEGPSAYVPAGALSALAGLSKPGPLAKLTTLDICDRALRLRFDYHAGEILEAAAGSLATLNVHMSGGPTQKVGRGRLRNLRTLRITHTRLSAAELAALLDSFATPGLKSFTYEATYPSANLITECFLFPDDRDHFQPSDAIQPLKRHRATLQSLHLDLRARGYNPTTDGGDCQPLSKTLKDFTALRHVFLSASVLYNHYGRASYTNYDSVLLTKLLPTSITSLSLAGSLGGLTLRLGHALVYLAKSAGPRKEFKALRRVRCDVLATRLFEDMAVKKAFTARGVDFAFDSWPLSEPTRRSGEETPTKAPSMRDGDIPLPDDDEDL